MAQKKGVRGRRGRQGRWMGGWDRDRDEGRVDKEEED